MDRSVPPSPYSISSWLLQHLIYPFCRLYFFRLKGWNLRVNPRLGQISPPVILAVAPHLSHTDVVVVPASLPRRLLPVRWLADKKIFTSRTKSLWLKLWGAIPVERDSAGAIEHQDIAWIIDFVQQGKCVGVFPECCLVGGHFGAHHRDLVSAALARSLPVYPVGLVGQGLDGVGGQTEGKPNKPQVMIGEPLSDPRDLLDRLTPP